MSPSRVKMAPRRPVLWVWGIVTALFVVCAYVMALAIAAGCALLCLAVLRSVSLTSFLVALGAAACALTILWSMAPRPDRFQPPGPELDAAGQPRLFAEIAQIAEAFEEPLPASVYLMLEPNAWVARRGGFLGFGSRRVMAIGLPLLSVLTVSELRAVLAHEFAHYYGGDTGFGPWIQRARETLARSLKTLTTDSAVVNMLSRWAVIGIMRLVIVLIFSGYWKLFLRLTLLVSRQWEYRADELACAAAGAKPLMEGLRKIEGATLAWPSFWQTQAVPALLAGFGPPIGDGFGRYLRVPAIAGQLSALVKPRLEKEKPDGSDTHPTFRQRMERAAAYRFEPLPSDDSSALTLFQDTGKLERSAVKLVAKDGVLKELEAIDWPQIGPVILLPSWTAFVAECREALVNHTVADLPGMVSGLGDMARQLRDPKGRLLTRQQRLERAATLLWTAFALALAKDGWLVQSEPGDCCLVRAGRRVVPQEVVALLRVGKMSEGDFRKLLEDIGAADLPLAPG